MHCQGPRGLISSISLWRVVPPLTQTEDFPSATLQRLHAQTRAVQIPQGPPWGITHLLPVLSLSVSSVVLHLPVLSGSCLFSLAAFATEPPLPGPFAHFCVPPQTPNLGRRSFLRPQPPLQIPHILGTVFSSHLLPQRPPQYQSSLAP